MSRNVDELPRTAADFILFAIMFVGFLFGAAGVVMTSWPACAAAGFLIAVGLVGFMVRNPLRF